MTYPEPQTDFEDNLPQGSVEPPPKKRRWLWLLLAVLLLGGTLAVVWRLLTPKNSAPTTANVQPSGVRVKVSTVQSGTVEESSDFIATLEPARSVGLQSRIQGKVTQIFAKVGDPIVQGAAIIQVDSRGQQATVSGIQGADQAYLLQLENARVTLKSLETERLSYVANLQLIQQDYEKYSVLAEQGAVSRLTKEQSANRFANAKAGLGAIDSRIQAQRSAIVQGEKILQQAKEQPTQPYYKITAPISGIVGDIPVKVGDLVNISTPLVTITQNQPLAVKILVPLERLPQLRKGMPVEVMNQQGQALGTGRVFVIVPNASNETQAILVKAIFNNSQAQLRPDQLVKARVIWNQRPGILIPKTAVSRVAGETVVYVAETEIAPQGVFQQVARQKRVKLGNVKGNNYQVLEGLQPENQVIVSELLNIKDGVPIVSAP